MKLILMRLGFILNERDEGSYRVIIPDHRMDVLQEEDLVEEIARIYGYDKIPATVPKGAPPEIRLNPERRFESKVGEILRSSGLTEEMCIRDRHRVARDTRIRAASPQGA